jgi:Mg2+ and Co2+ transporter CorA
MGLALGRVPTILETNLTIQGNRLNSIMRKVTSWAIIAMPTAVIVLSGGLYLLVRRLDWL